jgi:hypothetical protein
MKPHANLPWGASMAFLVLFIFIAPAGEGAECGPAVAGGPMLIMADCVDPLFNAETFVVENTAEMTSPSAHTKVIAHFKSSAKTPEYKVTIYLPPREKWQRRFFQHAYPLEQKENLRDVSFALANGGYLVNVKGTPSASGGYRVDAAAAKLGKEYAKRFYGAEAGKIYGYLWGGSGGALQTIGAAENTIGVWDGAVPYVMPNEASLLNANAVGALVGLALKEKLTAISESVKPGGNNEPFAGLDEGERVILKEALQTGLPLRSFETVFPGGMLLMFLSGGVKSNDPGYVDDFWSKPGYEGSNPPPYLQRAKVDEFAGILQVNTDDIGLPTSVTLDHAPNIRTAAPMSLEFWLYAADGKTRVGMLNGEIKDAIFTLKGNGPELLKQLASGAKLRVNNLFYLALHFYHRHAFPKGPGHYTCDQFRNADGSPRYPQRRYLASTEMAVGTAGGGTQTGKINMKVIVQQSIVDAGAQPWMADWYSRQVKTALGEKAHADNFRLWFNDNAEHSDSSSRGSSVARIISYVPSLYQALRDLVAWAERGEAPPASTRYTVTNGQVHLLSKAGERRGIQPVIDLTVNGSKRIEVAVNQPVEFSGRIEVPPSAGKVVSTGWWFGEDKPAADQSPLAKPQSAVELRRTYTYSKPGTYFVTLFGSSQRAGEGSETSTAIQNLDRVRVVVR